MAKMIILKDFKYTKLKIEMFDNVKAECNY